MIINRDNIYYYGNDGFEPRPDTSLFSIRDFDDKDYWYIDFFHGHCLAPAVNHIPSDVLDRIRAGSATLLLNNSHEAYHDLVEYIYLYFVDGLNLPPAQITLLSESAIINEEVKIVAEKYNTTMINTEWLRIFEYNMATVEHEPITTLEYKPYIKKFLNLNRRWRVHRATFVAMAKIHNLLAHGYVSLAPADDGVTWHRIWDRVQTHEPELIPHKDLIVNMPPLYLDTYDMHINQVNLTESTDSYYTDTYFSVVTETNFYKEYGPGLFLSEKVFKPVNKKHPFLVLGRPYTIKKFTEIGYTSFSDIIDESYDSEIDDTKRMRMVIEETKRLCNLSDDELKNFLSKAKEITEYNHQLLKDKKEFITPL